jgi:molybdenum cofactor synthesis domain-containing protein
VYPDESGPAAAAALGELGFDVVDVRVVPDGPPVGEALRAAVAERYALVVTTGGTGLAPDDVTPEQTAPLLDRTVPGLAEAVRAAGVAAGATAAVLSRGVAGLAGRTLVVNLPGSTSAVVESLAAIGAALVHAADQVGGGDHRRHGRAPDGERDGLAPPGP